VSDLHNDAPGRGAGRATRAVAPLGSPKGRAATAALDAVGEDWEAGDPRDSKIMLVDDEPINIEVISAFLEENGYRDIIQTSEPTEALAMLAEARPDVLLLDIVMPGVDGFDILARMRTDSNLRHTPVIVLTASTDAATKLRALELGATDFLAKPVDPSELALRLRNSLAAKAYRDRLANYDRITGLPNRHTFTEQLERALRHTARVGTLGALLLVGVDRFKKINDAFGVEVGDAILKAVSQRIDDTLRGGDLVARAEQAEPRSRDHRAVPTTLSRLGGDEFVVLLAEIDKAQGAATVARRLLEVMQTPFHAPGQELNITVSIGITVFPTDGMAPGNLLSNAQVALRHAKQEGGGAVAYYSERLNAGALKRLAIENELRRALASNELRLYYQPKVKLANDRGVGAEALIRWMHPERGMIAPGEFIPIAEESGLITQIGEWTLREACRQIRTWRDAGCVVPRISINIAARQMRGDELVRSVKQALLANQLEGRALMLELTESAIMDDAAANVRKLRELKELGASISIDDFGTGYSSLSYLKKFPIDELKIDRSFVADADVEADSAAIVTAIIMMAHSLGLIVVAEGIEKRSQMEFLRARGCDEGQGFLLARPMPAEAFGRMLPHKSPTRLNAPVARASRTIPPGMPTTVEPVA